MLPVRHPSLFASPAELDRHAFDVAGHASTMAAIMGHYREVEIVTPDGLALAALGMPAGETITQTWPASLHLPNPSMDTSKASAGTGTALAHHTANLDFLATHYQLFRCGTKDGRQLWVHARYLGPSHAMPFRVHLINGDESLLCVGGRVIINDVEHTVKDAVFKTNTGMVCLELTEAGSSFVMTDGSPSGAGSSPWPIYCPIASVFKTRDTVRLHLWSTGLQKPTDFTGGGADGRPRIPFLVPTGASGSLLKP